jgi:DNA-binding Lrp family transcriptional regulator
MASDTTHMGRNIELTEEQVLAIMRYANRPVWTASKLAERAGVARSTATKRLKKLAEAEEVETVQVGNATAYYLVGIETQPVGDGEEPIKRDLRRSFEDRFVGLPSAPWTAVHPNDGPAEAGDKIQIQVEGRPGNWRSFMTRLYENRRQELHYNETDEEEVQALISGELYEKSTVPIEHTDYPDDYDLELNIGAEFKGDPPKQALIAAGVKNYLIRPCNDAVFLKNVEVDWLCPIGEGQELETVELEVPNRESSKRPPEVQKVIDEHAGDTETPDFPTEPDYKADIVMLSDDCEPKRAYLEAHESEEADYRVIPADFEGNELGADYEPTDQFKKEVREKTAVDGDLQFERTWLEE